MFPLIRFTICSKKIRKKISEVLSRRFWYDATINEKNNWSAWFTARSQWSLQLQSEDEYLIKDYKVLNVNFILYIFILKLY